MQPSGEGSKILAGQGELLRPPPKLSLSEWADAHYYLSAESAATPGRWHAYPFQRGIMDAVTDPVVERISVMKSARVGATKILNAIAGYYMHHDPCPILVVQPTVEDAQGHSKEELVPMLRDCPELAKLLGEPSTKTAEQTILHKTFRGGVVSLVGANSARGFRRVGRRILLLDEVDAYPPSAGQDGDPVLLAERRSEYYWNRKICAFSTPLIAGSSRIEQLFDDGDQRRFYVPCPHCGHMDVLAFRAGELGHVMQWPRGDPARAYFHCRGCARPIEERHKQSMLARGEWRAHAAFRGHASFHLWAAYSLSPNATWGDIAEQWLKAQGKPRQLQTVVNTVLGETWREVGEAPEWERLYERRESYEIGTVPAEVEFLTQGMDVQKDRVVYEVVGWRSNKESFSVDMGIIWGDIASEKTRREMDAQVERLYPGPDGTAVPIRATAIDSGYNTQEVYAWARRFAMSRVLACKGVASERALLGTPSPVDVTIRGRTLKRGYKVWPVGVDQAKSQLYGWLRLAMPELAEPFEAGYCHFPNYDQEFFRQLTAEHLVAHTTRSGFVRHEWTLLPGRENHFLDCRILARAAASMLGLDRAPPPPRPSSPPTATSPPIETGPSSDASPRPRPQKGRGSWLGTGPRGQWLRKRR